MTTDGETHVLPTEEPGALGAAEAGRWVALHRANGRELAEADAPGYQRAPYDPDVGVRFPPAPADWGWCSFLSVWSRKVGGRCLSGKHLIPFRPGWLRKGNLP